MKIIINTINGIIKWIEKNRLIRILSILKFPHNHNTIEFPTRGIDERKFVITIIAQYDIWFQISEYPINDSIIIINIIIRPEIHIVLLKCALKYSLRLIWINIRIKIIEVIFLWKIRIIQP